MSSAQQEVIRANAQGTPIFENIGEPMLVAIKIPALGNHGEHGVKSSWGYLEHLNNEQFLHFGIPVGRTWINWHVRNVRKDDGVPGSTRLFSVQPERKVMPNGREFVQFNLTLANPDMFATHERKIYAKPSMVPDDLPDGSQIFTPATDRDVRVVFKPVA